MNPVIINVPPTPSHFQAESKPTSIVSSETDNKTSIISKFANFKNPSPIANKTTTKIKRTLKRCAKNRNVDIIDFSERLIIFIFPPCVYQREHGRHFINF